MPRSAGSKAVFVWVCAWALAAHTEAGGRGRAETGVPGLLNPNTFPGDMKRKKSESVCKNKDINCIPQIQNEKKQEKQSGNKKQRAKARRNGKERIRDRKPEREGGRHGLLPWDSWMCTLGGRAFLLSRGLSFLLSRQCPLKRANFHF